MIRTVAPAHTSAPLSIAVGEAKSRVEGAHDKTRATLALPRVTLQIVIILQLCTYYCTATKRCIDYVIDMSPMMLNNQHC